MAVQGIDPDRLAERVAAAKARVPCVLRLMETAGRPVVPPARVLDFGCGLGALVQELAAQGFDASGCDFAEELGIGERLVAIEIPYRLPFQDHSFDFVFSNEVFEHVQDYQPTLHELRRVLRPGGVSVHIFPARYLLWEPHVFVPLGTIIQGRAWLRLWAQLGVRNSFQQGKSASEVTELNYAYLRDHTTYYKRRRVLSAARSVFSEVRMLDVEWLAARPGRLARDLHAVAQHVPALATLLAETRARALLLA